MSGDADAQGWAVIAVVVIGIAASVIPVSLLTVGVFIKPLGQAFGWGRGEISLAVTLLSLAMAVTLPLAGRMIDRLGVRLPFVISLIVYAASIVLIPTIIDRAGKTGLYVSFLWLGIVGAPSSSVAFVKILSDRFDQSRGLALGFAMSGIALGGAANPVLAASLIHAHGWRAGFYTLALLPVAVGLPAALFLTRPAACPQGSHMGGPALALPGLTVSQALRTRIFATLFFLFLIDALAVHGIQIHLAPLLSDRGLSPEQAALGVASMFGVSLVVRLITGYLFDRVFAPWVGGVAFLLTTIGTALLIPSPLGIAGIIGVALLGVGAGSESDLLAFLVGRYFGLRNFGAIFGVIFGAFMIGSALGPLFIGLSFDANGTYEHSLFWCCLILAFVTILMFSLPRFPQESSAIDRGTSPEEIAVVE